jgi:hypothetical protein
VTTSPHDGRPDDTEAEAAVRHGLRTAAGTVTPSLWPAEAVRARARRARRTRRLATVLPMAAAVTVAAVLTTGLLRDRATGGPSGPTTPPAGQSTAVPQGPAVQVVAPERSIDIGAGLRMRLAPTKRCFSSGGSAWQCEDTASDDGGTPWIDPEVRTAPSGTVYVPLFIGPRAPARMTLTFAGRHAYPLRMAALWGAPGYTVGYLATSPPLLSGSLPETTVTAYDQQGNVLATVTEPASN